MNHFSDLLRAPWAMSASHLQSLERMLASIAGLDMPELAARLGFSPPMPPKPSTTTGGVAIIPISGYIVSKPNILTMLGLATASSATQDQIGAANADPAVKAVLLAIDSPGGSVNGTPSVAEAVRASAKPTVAVADGTMASAAYWIGSAADAVYATERTSQVGSIGVAAVHQHQPAADGRVVTEITSGKYKRIASPNKPLDAEGAGYLQAQIDHLCGVFLGAVATNRGVSMEQAMSMADEGRVYIGQQAVDVGLIDGISSINSLVARLSADPTSLKRRGSAPSSTTPAAAGASTAYAAVAAPPLLPPLTKAQKAERVHAHIAQHGGDFLAVYKALGFDALHPHEQALVDVAQFQAEHRRNAAYAQLADARRYAATHRVSLIAAVQALGIRA